MMGGVVAAVIAAVVAAVAGVPAVPAELPEDDARTVLAGLPVKGRAPATGYDRDLFPHWRDTDKDGCEADEQVLHSFAAELVLVGPCREVAGRMIDPYSGEEVRWGRSRAGIVDVDHIVPLRDAWVKGAQSWPAEKRLEFANDQANLVPTQASLNRAKGDSDAASWLPPDKPARCRYVAAQVEVKAKYGLWVTAPERDAIARVLDKCPAQTITTNTERKEQP